MSHDEPMRIRDLPTRQIEAALKLTGADISFTQLLAIESFLEQIGGIDNARLALDTLRKIESQPSADHAAEEDELEQVEFVFEEDEIDDDEDAA